MSQSMDRLRRITPDSGAYLVWYPLFDDIFNLIFASQNEADVLEPNPAGLFPAVMSVCRRWVCIPSEAYWGHHYDRLASIKKK